MKKWAGNLLALALGLAVALVLAEGLVRLIGGPPAEAAPEHRLNALGYRDVERSTAKPEGVVRIAFVGDSYTFGRGVAEEERFSNLVAQRLDAEWPQVRAEGLNFGREGADAATNLRTIRNWARQYEPDAIVYSFVLNDFATRPVLDAYHARYRDIEERYRARWSWLVGSAQYSRLAGLANSLLTYRYSGLRENQLDYLAGLYEPGEDFDKMSEALRDALEEMQNVRKGVVVFLPYFLEGEAELEFYVRARQLVREAAARHGHTFIEVLPHLAERPYHEWWVSEADHHPNAAAHEIIAELIVEAFLRGESLAERDPAEMSGS